MTKYHTQEERQEARRQQNRNRYGRLKKNLSKYQAYLIYLRKYHKSNYVPHPIPRKTPEELRAKRVATARIYRTSPHGIMMRHAYHQTPHFKKWNREYFRKYQKLPKWKKYIVEYYKRQDVIERRRAKQRTEEYRAKQRKRWHRFYSKGRRQKMRMSK